MLRVRRIFVAAEVRAVVDETPRDHAVEVLAELMLSETHTDLVVGECDQGMVIEGQVAEMDVGIDAAEVAADELHEVQPGASLVAALPDIDPAAAGHTLAKRENEELAHGQIA